MIEEIKKVWPGETEYPNIKLFNSSDWKDHDAYLWDSMIHEYPKWQDVKYIQVGVSSFWDQLAYCSWTPIHNEGGLYVLGPDISGPENNQDWPDNLLYFGSDIKEWLNRLDKYGDEYAIIPGDIEEELNDPTSYTNWYRKLNPGIIW